MFAGILNSIQSPVFPSTFSSLSLTHKYPNFSALIPCYWPQAAPSAPCSLSAVLSPCLYSQWVSPKTPRNYCLSFTKTASWTWGLACRSQLMRPPRSYEDSLPSLIQFFRVTRFWDVSSWKNGSCCSFLLTGRVECCSINCSDCSLTRCADWLYQVINSVVSPAFSIG